MFRDEFDTGSNSLVRDGEAARRRDVPRRSVEVGRGELEVEQSLAAQPQANRLERHEASASPQHALVAKAKTKKVAFMGSYSGTIALLWSSTSVTATSLRGTGTISPLGSSKLTGSGTSSPTSTCDPFSGAGTISGGGSVIHFKIVSSSS